MTSGVDQSVCGGVRSASRFIWTKGSGQVEFLWVPRPPRRWHTAAVTMRLLVMGEMRFAGGLIGAGGDIAWPRPTCAGDILRVESEIIEIKPSRSKPDRRGFVTVKSVSEESARRKVEIFTAKILGVPAARVKVLVCWELEQVGGYAFGGQLAEAGRDVTFLVRPKRAAELAAAGLMVKSRYGDIAIAAPQTVTAENVAGPYDLVLLRIVRLTIWKAL